MLTLSGGADQSYSKDIEKAKRFLTIWCRTDWIEISVFEEEIQDFPGFCKEEAKLYGESVQNLR
jgi:hypothetical protein